jgi:hypothetical protein
VPSALRLVKNYGRKQRECHGKKMGTNEIISEVIYARTGIRRNRKMVSSHLQVLKGFLKDCPECKLSADLCERPTTNLLGMALVTPVHDESGEVDEVEHLSTTAANKPDNFEISDGQSYPYFSALPPPSDILPSSRRSSVRRINFEMYILGPELEKIHVYTSLQSEIGSASRGLDEISDWRLKFPQIASYFDQGTLHGEIILFETSFRLMDNHPPIKMMGSQAPLRSKLGVDFDVDIDQGAEYRNWECHSKFYEKGVLKETLGTPTRGEPLLSGEARVVVLHLSQWWVDRFTNIIKERLQRENERDSHAMQLDAERARRQIRDITAVQEIWATSEADGSQRKRMAIFLWNFRQCQDHEAPTTTWRKVIPPLNKPEAQSPIQSLAPPFQEPCMMFDPISRHHDMLQPTPLYAEYFHPQPFLGEHSEQFLGGLDARLGTPLLPIADTRSFPSSTSDSFPSSIHSSAFHVETPQESSYGSQGSILHPEGSTYSLHDIPFKSQNSIYSSQELERRSEEPSNHCSHESLFCHDVPIEGQQSSHTSRDHYYQLQDAAAYSEEAGYSSSAALYQPNYPRHHSFTNRGNQEISPGIQDFSGGHIQLSYAAPEEAMCTYSRPYVAPPARMTSQENDLVGFESHSQEAVPEHHERQPEGSLDVERWQTMNQAVRWANAQFPSDEYEEVTKLLMNNEPVMEDLSDLQAGIDVDLGLL